MPHHRHRHRWSSCRTLTCAQRPGGSAHSPAVGSWPGRRSGSLPWASSCRSRPPSGHEASEAPPCCKRASRSCKGSQAGWRRAPAWASRSTVRSCRKPSHHHTWRHQHQPFLPPVPRRWWHQASGEPTPRAATVPSKLSCEIRRPSLHPVSRTSPPQHRLGTGLLRQRSGKSTRELAAWRTIGLALARRASFDAANAAKQELPHWMRTGCMQPHANSFVILENP